MMKLIRPIIFFDVETTGLDVAKDRIVKISLTKHARNQLEENRSYLINPTMPIPAEATAIHHITDEMVKDKPVFKEISQDLHFFMMNCDLIGFNILMFDLPILLEEFTRCGIDFPNPDKVKAVDCCYLFRVLERRDLSSAYKFYCGEGLINAHDSDSDVIATEKVFWAQLEKYPQLKGKSMNDLDKMCNPHNRIDWQSKVIMGKGGHPTYNFGARTRGVKVKDDVRFAEWVRTAYFPIYLKNNIKKIINKLLGKNELAS